MTEMKIITVYFLCIFYCAPFTTLDGVEVKNQIICEIAGKVWKSTYVFDIAQLPERCDIVLVGEYAFNRDDGVDIHMMEADKAIVTSLVAAQKTTYVRTGFVYGDDWNSLFNPTDTEKFQKQMLDPLVNFLNTFKVNGIIIDFYSIYEVEMDGFEQKLSDFVSNIKAKVNNLKVGFVTLGSEFECFKNKTLFDFTITNKDLDLYIIDCSGLNICDKDTVKVGISPVKSDIPNMVTLEQVTSAVTSSSMDKTKVYALLQMVAFIPDNLLYKDASHSITTYPIFCNSTDRSNSSHWCVNPQQLSYDQGVHAKQNYHGIVLDTLDSDDYEGCCECGKFPVLNQIIDGFLGSTLKTCPKLENK